VGGLNYERALRLALSAFSLPNFMRDFEVFCYISLLRGGLSRLVEVPVFVPAFVRVCFVAYIYLHVR